MGNTLEIREKCHHCWLARHTNSKKWTFERAIRGSDSARLELRGINERLTCVECVINRPEQTSDRWAPNLESIQKRQLLATMMTEWSKLNNKRNSFNAGLLRCAKKNLLHFLGLLLTHKWRKWYGSVSFLMPIHQLLSNISQLLIARTILRFSNTWGKLNGNCGRFHASNSLFGT